MNLKNMNGRKSNYDKTPFITVPGEFDCWTDWKEIIAEIGKNFDKIEECNTVVVETYQGVFDDELTREFRTISENVHFIDTRKLFKSEGQIRDMTAQDVTDDEIFGYRTRLKLMDFFDIAKFDYAQRTLKNKTGINIVYGPGAALVECGPTVLVYADMPRWEIQQRFRTNTIGNLGLRNEEERFSIQYKRGFFVDWLVCDRHKKDIFDRVDYFLDTSVMENPKMVVSMAMHQGLKECTNRPFRTVPFFDSGVWGGQWMKKVCELDDKAPNYAWCFDCVPEENSLYLKIRDVLFETPSINLVFRHPEALLGGPVYSRFGDAFPIRFNFLDTMEGGNLSLQVHPFTEYIQENFGMHFTQDESYYILDTGDDAVVHLGLNEDTKPEELITSLKKAQETGQFESEKYIAQWKIKKHDHILIPAGTIHCSGKNSMVLEISAAVYNFTFKLWDWGRLGLDGRPRPINIERGEKNISWERDVTWCKGELINQFETLEEIGGCLEERTGLHEREFIETRRHWFTEKTQHVTGRSVNVLNLVEGREVIVESPDNSFTPFIIHYAETFIVPANVETYTIAPYGESIGKKCATIKAFVRH
ncbi:class I mannose-6-phosphate isomerase [Flavobacteriaceae bacterium F89]|uniref:Class I mannose-6-phosphate isomerase n=1 Tax=Cerina litoralis TaxID=2874477 RepID=A0AAE3EXV5_9FLAO|nr:class I mannose-6-phosphate isomerase [Cerina litoralis]MCG2462364.1 class I mannose-6-phosphate isomerase [Cerina litoralis]